jgi:hypothetical protein
MRDGQVVDEFLKFGERTAACGVVEAQTAAPRLPPAVDVVDQLD